MRGWLARHLPKLPEVDEDNISLARQAVEKSTADRGSAVEYRRMARKEASQLGAATSRNHLVPSFEAAFRRSS